MKHIKVFENFLAETWTFKTAADMNYNVYRVKQPFSERSRGASAPFAGNNNSLNFEAGDAVMINVQDGSLGTKYSLQKVKVEGENLVIDGAAVTIWEMDYGKPAFFNHLEPYKK